MPSFACLVERGGWFIEQQHLGLVGQGARQRDSLLLAAGEIGDIAGSESGQADALQQVAKRSLSDSVSPRCSWPEAQVGRHVAGKQKRTLRNHADAAAQFARGKLAIVLAFEKDGAAGGLVEAIQQAQKRALARTAGTDDAQQLSATYVERDIIDDGDVSDARGRDARRAE